MTSGRKQTAEHIFKLSSSGKYRCIYCNHEASS
ncbi:MAG: hypothetical protein ACLUTU_07560 [Blautia faecis]